MFIKRLIEKRQVRRNPVRFWRKRGMIIGDDCQIMETANFGSEPYLISIGNHVRIGGNVLFFTHEGAAWVLRTKKGFEDVDIFRKIKVGDNVHIAPNAIIMPGVTIGSNTIIGCGAIVTKDIPDNSIAVGVPARVIRTIYEFEEKNKKDFVHTKHLNYEEKKKFLIDYFNNKKS